MDAAFGMEYLHSKSIVHFDIMIKCDNLLVNLKDLSRPICKDDITGEIVDRMWIKVHYDEVPPYCSKCMHIGHDLSSCKRQKLEISGDVGCINASASTCSQVVQADSALPNKGYKEWKQVSRKHSSNTKWWISDDLVNDTAKDNNFSLLEAQLNETMNLEVPLTGVLVAPFHLYLPAKNTSDRCQQIVAESSYCCKRGEQMEQQCSVSAENSADFGDGSDRTKARDLLF